MIQLKYIINNLGRKKKQTFFTVLCIGITSFIIFADFSMINGIEKQLKKGINEVFSGEYIIYQSDKENINVLESNINEQEEFEWNTEQTHLIETVYPGLQPLKRVRIGSIVSYEEETSYTHIHALEDRHLRKIAQMLTLTEGQMPCRTGEMIISRSLADDLGCTTGDTLLLLAGNIHNYMTDATAIVTGIFEEKGLALFMTHTTFMTYPTGEEIAGISPGHAIEVILNAPEGEGISAQTAGTIHNSLLKINPRIHMANWTQTIPLMNAIVNVWKGGGAITQVIFILFSLIILITLSTQMIRSRKKEIGTLVAIGFTWKKITRMLLAEYTIITLISVTLSALLLLALMRSIPGGTIPVGSEYMQSALMTDTLPPSLYLRDYLYVLVLFIATTLTSVGISLRKLKKHKINQLINN